MTQIPYDKKQSIERLLQNMCCNIAKDEDCALIWTFNDQIKMLYIRINSNTCDIYIEFALSYMTVLNYAGDCFELLEHYIDGKINELKEFEDEQK